MRYALGFAAGLASAALVPTDTEEAWMHRASVGMALVVALAAGCHMEQRYVTPEGGGVFTMAITETTPPYFMGEEDALYLVEQRIELAIRAPDAAQLAALTGPDPLGRVHPFPSLPWVERGDVEMQVDFQASNLESEPVVISLVLNGINEFNEYVPGVQDDEEALIIDFAQWERTFVLMPGERRQMTVREEELDEVAVDLATVVNGAPNANQIVYFMNQSATDVRSQMFIPGVIPGLVGVRVGLRTESTVDGHGARVALETSVRLRDVGDRVASTSETPWTLPVPVPFTPVPIEE